MSRGILRDRDFLAGLFFMGVGAGTLWQGAQYQLGTLTNMGPGYFPVVLGVLLLFFGSVALLSALFSPARVPLPAIPVRPLLAISVSIVAFALLLDRIGLIFSVLVSSMLASAARPRVFGLANLALALLLAATCTLVFIHLLGVPMRLLPAALQGY